MTRPELFLFALIIGALLGGLFVAWLSWAYLHQKVDQLEHRLIAQLSAIETSILSKVHLVREQPAPAAAPSPAPVPPAAAASAPAPRPPAPGDVAHSG